MKYEVHTIRAAGKKEVPGGTKIVVRLGSRPGTVHVLIQLPGQRDYSDLGDVLIVDGVVELPVKLPFLSYAREDQIAVRAIAEELRQDGFLIWLDAKDLLPGDDWKARIEDAIERADYVLVFLANNSVNKVGYVQRELKYALEQQDLRPSSHRYMIPILLEPCNPPRELSSIQWLKTWETGFYEKLVKVLRS
jgi:hypothetical protein